MYLLFMIEVCKRKEILTGEILAGYGWSIKKWLYGLGLEAFFFVVAKRKREIPRGQDYRPILSTSRTAK